MRYKEIDINIKAIPEPEDEAILNQLIGNKKASVSTDAEETPTTNNSNNPGKVDSDDPNTVPPMYPICLLYTSPSPRDRTRSRMPSSA